MAELRTLPGDLADAVARYMVATGVEEDPERAYQYAVAARGLAARVGIVRETTAIAAYQAGRWADALTEFRAARRLTGRNSYLPLMADCERALGRLDRALDIVTGPEARSADRATQIELRIVESGIRRDQDLPAAAVVALQVPELTDKRGRGGRARLYYAYADALLDADRGEEAREWFGKAAAADSADETDAAERVEELDAVLFEDLDDAWDDPDDADGADPDDEADLSDAATAELDDEDEAELEAADDEADLADGRPADEPPADDRPADGRPADEPPADEPPADGRPADGGHG
jgi:tetratricopeptide (TPR) repeat protein